MSDVFDEVLDSKTVCRDGFNMLLGRFIGSGSYRKVFHSRIDASVVIKVETESGHFANIMEWEVWNQVEHSPAGKFFAPCISISPCGIVMIQAKTTPVSIKDLPKKVPGFVSDITPRNWGWYKGRVVCHDYGNILVEQSSALKKAKWQ